MTEVENRYKLYQDEIALKIKELQKIVNAKSSNIGWGHVGNLTHIYELISNAVDFANNK